MSNADTMTIRIGHVCPEYLNLYGDGGNLLVMRKRCEWRGMRAQVVEFKAGSEMRLDDVDILLIGGGSDRDQKVVASYLCDNGDEIKRYVEDGGCLLAVCGGYQLLGKSYEAADGTVIDGIGAVDMVTVKGDGRLIGNIAIDCSDTISVPQVVGFENHAGRTILGDGVQPLGRVVSGYGNDGNSGYEGCLYRNVIGTYLHGPLLPKNPGVFDWLLQQAVEHRYGAGAMFDTPDDMRIGDKECDLAANQSVFDMIVAMR